MLEHDAARGDVSADLLAPTVALVGTSRHFSDQLLRVLRSEFDGVRFLRIYDRGQLFVLESGPEVVVAHDKVAGLDALVEEVRSAYPASLIALACGDKAILQRFNRASAHAPVSLLQMNAQIDVWFSVLHLLLCGHPYVPADMPQDRTVAAEPEAEPDAPGDADVRLTPRELEILPLIAAGKQNKMIAGDLGLSEHTVKLHTHNIFAKLRVSNRTGAAHWYLSQMEGKRNVDHGYGGK